MRAQHKSAAERKRMESVSEITEDTMFNDVLTVREFCVKLELCGFVVTRVEEMMGVNRGAVWSKLNREPWKEFFANKYPQKFGYKNGRESRSRKEYFTVTEIPCMTEGCRNIMKVEHEAGEPLPRGFRKRCSKCAGNLSESGLLSSYRNYRG